MTILTPLQLRLARAALGLGVRDLAEIAGVAPSTIVRFEASRGGLQTGTLERLQLALMERGIVFVAADDEFRAGIRLRSEIS